MTPPRLVVVGTSWGGLDALGVLLGALPRSFPLPIALVQHRGKDADDGLVEVLARRSALPVCEAEDKAPLEPGKVLLAPADYHLLIEAGGCALSIDPLVNHARPSIDVLFESAAQQLGPALIALLLTGSGRDGVEGLKAVKERGGRVLIEDPATAANATLPSAALAALDPDAVLPLGALARYLVNEASHVPPTPAPTRSRA